MLDNLIRTYYLVFTNTITMLFKNGDIIINRKRATIYYFDSKNREHKLDAFSCRLATFKEIEKFKELGVKSAKLIEIGLRRKEYLKKIINIDIEVHEHNIFLLNKIAKLKDFANYSEVITYLMSRYAIDKIKLEKEIMTINKNKERIKLKLLALINKL